MDLIGGAHQALARCAVQIQTGGGCQAVRRFGRALAESLEAKPERWYGTGMNLPFALPDWLPWWAPILLLVPALMWALAFLFMPFSVIGLKGRLEAMEAQLEELQSEVRGLAHRLPEPLRPTSYDDVYAAPGSLPASRHDPAPVISRPPIPPAAYDLHDESLRGVRSGGRRGDVGRGDVGRGDVGRGEAGRGARAEPRLDWPR